VKEQRERCRMLLSMAGGNVAVCLHTHRPTTGTLGEAGNVGPRQTGRPEEALPRAFATAALYMLLWPPNLHNTHCYSRLRDPPTQRARE